MFPNTKTFLPETSLDSISPQYIRQEMLNFAKSNLHSSQKLGLLFFSLNNDNEYYISFSGFPFLLVILRVFINRLIEFDYMKFERLYLEYFQIRSGTEIFSEGLLALALLVQDVANILVLLKQRHKVMKFQTRLNNFFVNGIYLLKENQIPSFLALHSCFQTCAAKVFPLKILLYSLTTLSIFGSLFSSFGAKPKEKETPWHWYFVLINSAIWAATTSSRVISKFWILGFISLLKVGYSVLSHNLKWSIREYTLTEQSGRNLESRVRRILQHHLELEEIVHEFNDVFGTYLLLELLSYTVVIFVTCFQACVWVAIVKSFQLGFVTNGTIGIAYISTLWYICKTAGQLEKQIAMEFCKGISIPLQVNPGGVLKVNRRTLTSVLKAVTTYIIVLVQFHRDEAELK